MTKYNLQHASIDAARSAARILQIHLDALHTRVLGFSEDANALNDLMSRLSASRDKIDCGYTCPCCR